MADKQVSPWYAIKRTGYLHTLFLLVFLILVIFPLVPLLADTICFVAADPQAWVGIAIPSGRVFSLFVNSVALASAVAISVTGIGVLAGTWLWSNARGIWGYLPWVLVMFIPVPSTLYFSGWSSCFSLTGWVPAWGIQVMMYIPFLTVFSYVGLRVVEREKIEAGRVVASDMVVYRHIVLPLAAPFILAGSGLVFIFSLLDYTVPSLCSVNVYALEIFAQFSARNQPSEAFLLSLPLMIVAGVMVFFSQYHIKKAFQNVSWERVYSPPVSSWPGWFSRITCIAAGITIIGTIFVLLFLLGSAILGRTVPVNYAVYRELVFSFAIALLAGALCLAPAMAAAREMSQYTRGSGVWWGISMIPLAVPAALAGIGMAMLSSNPALEPYTGGVILPVFVNIFRFIPIAAIVLCAQLRITERTLIEAGQIFSTGIIDDWRRIRIPLYFPGLSMAAYLVFAFSLGELGGTLMVVPPGFSTITIRLYNYLHYGASGSVAHLSLLLAVLVLLPGVVILIMVKVLRRTHTKEHAK